MKNYKIEGNIDFFSELYNSLDIEENQQKTLDDDNLCLISGTPLTEHFVKMNCGHKFNYIPLYNDIKNHKQKFNNMEGNASQLKHDEIRCPYCRNKQKDLLQYIEDLGLPKIHGVNFNDPNRKSVCTTSHYQKCEFLTPNPNYDASGNNPIEKATQYSQLNCQFFTCINNGFYQLSQFIPGHSGEDKCFCYYHKKKTLKDHNLAIKTKAKEEAKQAKLQEKQAKADAKEEAKQAKLQAKKKQKVSAENVVIGPSNVGVENSGCIMILKTGPNKGKPCGCKIQDEHFCKRHSKKPEPVNTGIVPEFDPEL
jgi:hypothetical protein